MRISLPKIALTVFGLLFFAVFWPDPLRLLFVLLFGWIPAGLRLAHALAQAGPNLLLPLLGIAAIVWGTHEFLSWLQSQVVANGQSARDEAAWPWRWTVGLLGGTALVLFAVMSLLGIAHQAGWILVSKEPVFVSSRGRYLERLNFTGAVHEFENCAHANGWDLDFARANFWTRHLRSRSDGAEGWEKYSVHLLQGTNGTYSEALIAPRDPRLQEQLGFAVVTAGQRPSFQRGSPAEIARRLQPVKSPR